MARVGPQRHQIKILVLHVSGAYAHHQEHWMLSCSIWFSAPTLWMGGGFESRCVGRVYGADPSTKSVQKTICCNSTSNAPDDGRMRRKRRAKNTSIKLPRCIKLAFYFIS